MRSGELKHLVTLQAATIGDDGMGGGAKTFTDFATVWAAIWPVSGKERLTGGELKNTITHRVIIRHLAGVETGMKVAKGARSFEITGMINKEEQNRSLELLCREDV